jgi:hypothetical protein
VVVVVVLMKMMLMMLMMMMMMIMMIMMMIITMIIMIMMIQLLLAAALEVTWQARDSSAGLIEKGLLEMEAGLYAGWGLGFRV